MAEQLRYLVPNKSDGATALKADQDALAAVMENEKLADDLGVKYLVDVYLSFVTNKTNKTGSSDFSETSEIPLGPMTLTVSALSRGGTGSAEWNAHRDLSFTLTGETSDTVISGVFDGTVDGAGPSFNLSTHNANGAPNTISLPSTAPDGTSLGAGVYRLTLTIPRSEMKQYLDNVTSLTLPSSVPAKGTIGISEDGGCLVARVPVGVYWFGMNSYCLRPGTPVRMADGTKRRIEDVRVGDFVLSVDPETGELVPDRVVAAPRGVGRAWDEWTFSDGTVVGTVGRHRFWNSDLGEFMYLEAWNEGERGVSFAGAQFRHGPALVSRVHHDEESEHHTLFTEKYNNYFAAGLLAGNRKSVRGRWL